MSHFFVARWAVVGIVITFGYRYEQGARYVNLVQSVGDQQVGRGAVNGPYGGVSLVGQDLCFVTDVGGIADSFMGDGQEKVRQFVLEMSGWLIELGQVGGVDSVGYGRVNFGKAVGDEVCCKEERQCCVLRLNWEGVVGRQGTATCSSLFSKKKRPQDPQ